MTGEPDTFVGGFVSLLYWETPSQVLVVHLSLLLLPSILACCWPASTSLHCHATLASSSQIWVDDSRLHFWYPLISSCNLTMVFWAKCSCPESCDCCSSFAFICCRSCVLLPNLLVNNTQLEKWQLTMYCHWRPPNVHCFGAPWHRRPNFDDFVYIHCAAPPYRLAIYFLLFGKVWLSSICWHPYVTPGNEAEHRIYRGCTKFPVLFEPVYAPKFMKFWDMLRS